MGKSLKANGRREPRVEAGSGDDVTAGTGRKQRGEVEHGPSGLEEQTPWRRVHQRRHPSEQTLSRRFREAVRRSS